jgi:hypothetical protein
MRIWGRRRDSVEEALRAAKPNASDELVGALTDQVLTTSRTRQQANRGSRLAFGAAVTVFMVGTFASFGGLGYAATTNAEKAAAPAKTTATQSAAAAQYDEEDVPSVVGQSTLTPPKSPPTVVVAGQSAGATPASGTLPFTGLGLGATAALGSMLLALGIVLRRRETSRE